MHDGCTIRLKECRTSRCVAPVVLVLVCFVWCLVSLYSGPKHCFILTVFIPKRQRNVTVMFCLETLFSNSNNNVLSLWYFMTFPNFIRICFRKWCIISVWGLRESSCQTWWLNTMDFHKLCICDWCWCYFLRSTTPKNTKHMTQKHDTRNMTYFLVWCNNNALWSFPHFVSTVCGQGEGYYFDTFLHHGFWWGQENRYKYLKGENSLILTWLLSFLHMQQWGLWHPKQWGTWKVESEATLSFMGQPCHRTSANEGY